MVKQWLEIDAEIVRNENKVVIPDLSLTGVPFLDLIKELDLKKIPKGGGCYWIWTNEKLNHSFHNHKIPAEINGGEIIYIGIAKDDVRGRIKKHLFGDIMKVCQQ